MRWIAFLSMILVFGCGSNTFPQQDKSIAEERNKAKSTKLYKTIEIICTPYVKLVNPHPPTGIYPKPSFILELHSGHGGELDQYYDYWVYDKKLVDSFMSAPDGVGYGIHTFTITPSQKQIRYSLYTLDVQVSCEGKLLYEGQLYKLAFDRSK